MATCKPRIESAKSPERTRELLAWCATVLDARTQRIEQVCWCRKVYR